MQYTWQIMFVSIVAPDRHRGLYCSHLYRDARPRGATPLTFVPGRATTRVIHPTATPCSPYDIRAAPASRHSRDGGCDADEWEFLWASVVLLETSVFGRNARNLLRLAH